MTGEDLRAKELISGRRTIKVARGERREMRRGGAALTSVVSVSAIGMVLCRTTEQIAAAMSTQTQEIATNWGRGRGVGSQLRFSATCDLCREGWTDNERVQMDLKDLDEGLLGRSDEEDWGEKGGQLST